MTVAERIVLLSSRFGRGSGTAGVAWALARGLRDRGYRVEVWCDVATEEPAGVRMRCGVPPPRTPGLRIGLDRVAHCQILRCSGGAHEAWRRVLRADPLRCWRGVGPSPTSWAERRAVRTARVLVCNSRRAARDVADQHDVPLASIRLVRNGVDLDGLRPDPARRAAVRHRFGVPEGGRVALFVAHGWYRKGLTAAVRGFRLAAGPRDRLVVMGRDSQARRRLAAARRALGERLVVAEGTDAIATLPAGDVLVHPTRYDASANVVLQAMACGVPPVTTAQDGAAEIVEDRRLIVANPDDETAIAASIRHAWEAPDLGARCRVTAERWPTSRMVEGVARIVEELQHG